MKRLAAEAIVDAMVDQDAAAAPQRPNLETAAAGRDGTRPCRPGGGRRLRLVEAIFAIVEDDPERDALVASVSGVAIFDLRDIAVGAVVAAVLSRRSRQVVGVLGLVMIADPVAPRRPGLVSSISHWKMRVGSSGLQIRELALNPQRCSTL